MPTSKHFWIVAILSASFVSSVVTPAIGQQPSAAADTINPLLPSGRRAYCNSSRLIVKPRRHQEHKDYRFISLLFVSFVSFVVNSSFQKRGSLEQSNNNHPGTHRGWGRIC